MALTQQSHYSGNAVWLCAKNNELRVGAEVHMGNVQKIMSLVKKRETMYGCTRMKGLLFILPGMGNFESFQNQWNEIRNERVDIINGNTEI